MISHFDWGYKYAEKCWCAMIKAAETIEVTITIAMRAQQKVYHFLANEEDPRRPTTPALPDEVTAAAALLPPHLALVCQLAYILGQRLGDCLNLTSPCCTVIYDPVSGVTFLSILFRRGKTTRVTQPFTLHLPMTHVIAPEILHLDKARRGRLLFCDDGEDAKMTALKLIAGALRQVNPNLTALSIRRGGLQAMALSGCSTETLLAHSRHQCQKNLERYLNWGALLLDPARERWVIKDQKILSGIRLTDCNGVIRPKMDDDQFLAALADAAAPRDTLSAAGHTA
jgi:hypothetical protein